MSNLSITRADSSDLELVRDMIRAYYAFDDIAFERERVFPGLSELIAESLSAAPSARSGESSDE